MPLHKLAFRVTHRFTRPLGDGDFGDLASDFFGFDSGAQIGLELRYGLAPRHADRRPSHERSNDPDLRAAQFLNERDGKPLGLDAIATLEGGNNLQEQYQSALGLWPRARSGAAAALYAEPMLVLNTNPAADAGPTTTRSCSARRRGCACARQLPRRRDHAAACAASIRA